MYYGHQNHTYYVKTCLSADGRYLASGSSDNLAYIWRINKPGRPLIKLSGHKEEVTCISWCNVGDLKVLMIFYYYCYSIHIIMTIKLNVWLILKMLSDSNVLR